MARSVDYLNGAQAVAYLSAHDIDDPWQWDLFQEDITERLKSLFPSLEDCDSWASSYDGGENHFVLENGHAEIAIAEYCGLVSVSLRAKEDTGDYSSDTSGLALRWVEQVKDKFLSIGDLRKVGTFSNGEAVFETATGPKHTYTSKEGLAEWLEGDN